MISQLLISGILYVLLTGPKFAGPCERGQWGNFHRAPRHRSLVKSREASSLSQVQIQVIGGGGKGHASPPTRRLVNFLLHLFPAADKMHYFVNSVSAVSVFIGRRDFFV